jgi:hypothetical protein
MSYHKNILNYLESTKTGKILFLSDFRGLGTTSAIKMSLSRISQTGDLKRLCHGIYVKSNKNKKKEFKINIDDVLKAISKKHSIRLLPSGDIALYKLHIISEMPKRLVYITDGEPKNLKIQDQTIVFKSSTPIKLSMRGETSSLIIQALEAIGKNNVNEEILAKLNKAIIKERKDFLLEDVAKAPAWIYDILFKMGKN